MGTKARHCEIEKRPDLEQQPALVGVDNAGRDRARREFLQYGHEGSVSHRSLDLV